MTNLKQRFLTFFYLLFLFVIYLPEAEVDTSPDGKADEPEPEEDVDLLVDDIEGKNAEAVFPLDSSRRTELVESTFCDLGEMNEMK